MFEYTNLKFHDHIYRRGGGEICHIPPIFKSHKKARFKSNIKT